MKSLLAFLLMCSGALIYYLFTSGHGEFLAGLLAGFLLSLFYMLYALGIDYEA